jgi:pimeloyl-ACP methyl ester carboxylesterase
MPDQPAAAGIHGTCIPSEERLMPRPRATGYAPVDGMDIYWESRGDGGVPLVVVHGGFGLASMFGELLGQLAGQRQVIAIELQAHGHTRDAGRPFSFEGFGDDIAAVIEHLGLGQADLLGYSLGGGACLRSAIQHPGRVRRLALGSAPCRRDGWFPEVLAGFDQLSSAGFGQMRQSPMYQAWCEVAPDRDAFPALMDKTGLLLRQPYDWTEEVRRLTNPALLAYADADSIPPAHAAEFFALLGGGHRDAGWDGSLAPGRASGHPARAQALQHLLRPPAGRRGRRLRQLTRTTSPRVPGMGARGQGNARPIPARCRSLSS